MTVAILAACIGTFEMKRITTTLSPGETVEAEFARGYKLEAYRSGVRIAGATVGKVRSVKATDHGTVVVSMKVSEKARDVLGSSPSASVRPTTLLGGVYYVSLAPGGTDAEFDGDVIPVKRTTVPVELDKVLSSLNTPAQEGVQGVVRQLDKTGKAGARTNFRKLLKDAPGTLEPTAKVLNAARGTRPGTDLTALVDGLQTTAATTTRRRGQLDSIFADLDRSTAALASGSQPLAEAISTLPQSLRTTRAGMSDLRGTMDRLTSTAESLQPTARSLDSLLEELDPVLVRARPVVHDARAFLADARPLVRHLIPTSEKATTAMTNVRGPVLDRVNGPIKALVLSPWKGTGPYAGGGNNNTFFEELAYLGVDGAKVFQTHDGNGAQGRLMAGIGAQTLGGGPVPMSLEQYFEGLGWNQPLGPQEAGQSQLPQLPMLRKAHP
jgi:phospholipid/cholesterol/gamma-HCH transport system substrate-binding protein